MKKYIRTRLGPLAVELVGNGPTMMMWPGLFVDTLSFQHQRDHFVHNHLVIVIDGPGHGANLDVLPTFSLRDCAGAAADILVATGSSRAVFVGSSWGAIVGLHLASLRPELVSRLVVTDARLHVPALGERLVRGEADMIVTAEMFAAYVAALPTARSAINPAAGHMSALQNPAAFNTTVENFLNSDRAKSFGNQRRLPPSGRGHSGQISLSGSQS